jgi:hypothetical protein
MDNHEYMNRLAIEKERFIEDFPELREHYEGQFIALYQGEVITHGSDSVKVDAEAFNLDSVLEESRRLNRNPPILVTKCDYETYQRYVDGDDSIEILPTIFLCSISCKN